MDFTNMGGGSCKVFKQNTILTSRRMFPGADLLYLLVLPKDG